jgi:hypothetical protein
MHSTNMADIRNIHRIVLDVLSLTIQAMDCEKGVVWRERQTKATTAGATTVCPIKTS